MLLRAGTARAPASRTKLPPHFLCGILVPVPSSTPKQNDLRPARADFHALGRALVISLILHALTYGGYRAAKKYHWLENLHLPAWLQKVEQALVIVPPAKIMPPQQQAEPPLLFVEVSPAAAITEAPKKSKFYSDKSSRAANSRADLETDTPKITGTQERIVKTEDVPRTKAFPLQPTPPPATKAEEPQEEQTQAAHPAGDITLAKLEPKPRPDPAATPKPAKPRTVAEALARQKPAALAGEKMLLDGGVAHFNLSSSLDVTATPFGSYDAAIVAAIQNHWYALLDDQRLTRGTGKVTIRFHLHDDGRVTDMAMPENTVGELLSILCERAIRDPAPFAPWPSDMRRLVGANFREVNFTFYYN